MEVFSRIFSGPAGCKGQPDRLMIDAPHLKVHRTAASLPRKEAVPCRIGRTKGGLNSKLHAACDSQGRPLVLLLPESQMNGHKGAVLMLPSLQPAKALLGDKGYDSDQLRQALIDRDIEPCIFSKRNRKQPIRYDKALHHRRHRIETMSERLRVWRCVAMRYDRCADTFFSPISLACSVLFWINES